MKQVIQAEDIYNLKSVSQMNQNSDYIFFIENSINKKENTYVSSIASIDKQDRYKVWASRGLNIQPASDHQSLFYLHPDNQGIFQLFKLSLQNTATRRLTFGKESFQQLLISPDKKTLILKTKETKETPKYKTTKFPKRRHVKKLARKQDNFGWFPNQVIFRLKSFDVQNQNFTALLTSKKDFDLKDVSQKGRYIAYNQEIGPYTGHNNLNSGIYVFDTRKQKSSWVTKKLPHGIFFDASFSKDNKFLALIGNDGLNKADYIKTDNLWLFNLETKTLKNLTQDKDDVHVGYAGMVVGDFAQQRAGKAIFWEDDDTYFFHAYHHGRSQLYKGNKNLVKLVDDKKRDIYDFTVLDANQILLSSSKQNQANTLNILDLNKGQEKTIYNPNETFDSNHLYSSPKRFSYKSRDESQTLSGWYLPPTAKTEKGKYPVALEIHGGPHGAYGETFFHEFQTLAGQGYGVVFVNPRGSTTYGQQFADYVVGHYGEKDYTDILDGLQAALGKFTELDPNRLFTGGGSYGGFMTAWIAGHTNRFKAIVSQRPLIDWQSFYGTSEIGFWFAKAQLGCDLFDGPKARSIYWQKSPLAYAKNVKTPLRLLHGEWDMDVPTFQSEEFFTAVKKAGGPVDYVRYPQSFHELSRSGLPSIRVKRLHDIYNWFNKFLNP